MLCFVFSSRRRHTRLQGDWSSDVCSSDLGKQLMEQFGYKTSMQVPRIEKIVINMGVGEAVADKKVMDSAVADMTKIAGQKQIGRASCRESVENAEADDGGQQKIEVRRHVA